MACSSFDASKQSRASARLIDLGDGRRLLSLVAKRIGGIFLQEVTKPRVVAEQCRFLNETLNVTDKYLREALGDRDDLDYDEETLAHRYHFCEQYGMEWTWAEDWLRIVEDVLQLPKLVTYNSPLHLEQLMRTVLTDRLLVGAARGKKKIQGLPNLP